MNYDDEEEAARLLETVEGGHVGEPQRRPDTSVEIADVDIDSVREVLLGDAIRSIREEVLCNHSIVLNRVDTLQKTVEKRVNAIIDRLDTLERELDSETITRAEQDKLMANQLTKEGGAIRQELRVITRALDTEAQTQRREFDHKLRSQAQDLIAMDTRFSNRLERNSERLGAQGLARADFAESLTALADQIGLPGSSVSANQSAGR